MGLCTTAIECPTVKTINGEQLAEIAVALSQLVLQECEPDFIVGVMAEGALRRQDLTRGNGRGSAYAGRLGNGGNSARVDKG